METLSIDHNLLRSIHIANCHNLTTLSCFGNRLGKIDISNNKALTYISFCYNPGKDGIMEIISWFDQANIPAELLSSNWWNEWTFDEGYFETNDYNLPEEYFNYKVSVVVTKAE